MKITKEMETPINELSNKENSTERPQGQNLDLEILARIIGKKTAYFTVQILRDFNFNLDALDKARRDELLGMLYTDTRTAYNKTEVVEYGRFCEPDYHPKLRSAVNIYDLMHPRMKDLDVEQYYILLIDREYRLIKYEKINQNKKTKKDVDIRVIMREVLVNNAPILAICHNRPNGSVCPSKSDDELTKSIKHSCEIMHIFFHDHVIISNENYYSYRDQTKSSIRI